MHTSQVNTHGPVQVFRQKSLYFLKSMVNKHKIRFTDGFVQVLQPLIHNVGVMPYRYHITRRQVTEDCNFYILGRVNLKYQVYNRHVKNTVL